MNDWQGNAATIVLIMLMTIIMMIVVVIIIIIIIKRGAREGGPTNTKVFCSKSGGRGFIPVLAG